VSAMISVRRDAPPSVVDGVRLESVTKVYGRGSSAVTALSELSLGLASGSFTAMMGPSGSGKSTFLQCAAGLDRPTSGSIYLGDVDLGGLSEDSLSRLRRETVGFAVGHGPAQRQQRGASRDGRHRALGG
jgi:ABC-type lipoprotein export system ATPase subunit